MAACQRRPADPIAPPTRLNVGLGYIPSVQFAPFYLAQQAGYYASAGLEVTFDHRTDTDVVPSWARARWTSASPTARASSRP